MPISPACRRSTGSRTRLNVDENRLRSSLQDA